MAPKRIFALVADAGFDGIELVLGPRTPLRRSEDLAAAAAAADRGLVICSVHESLAAGRLTGRTPAALLMDAVEAAVRTGAPIAVVHSPGTHTWDDPLAVLWLEALLRARDAVSCDGMTITVENAGYRTPDDRDRVLARLSPLASFCQRHALGVTLDTCHVGSSGQCLEDAWRLAGRLVRNVHLSDLRSLSGAERRGWGQTLAQEHRFPGEGELPLASFLRQIIREGYRGPITTEVSIAALGGWRPKRWSERLASLASWVKRCAREGAVENEMRYP